MDTLGIHVMPCGKVSNVLVILHSGTLASADWLVLSVVPLLRIFINEETMNNL